MRIEIHTVYYTTVESAFTVKKNQKSTCAHFDVRVFGKKGSRDFNSRRLVDPQETTDLSVAGGH